MSVSARAPVAQLVADLSGPCPERRDVQLDLVPKGHQVLPLGGMLNVRSEDGPMLPMFCHWVSASAAAAADHLIVSRLNLVVWKLRTPAMAPLTMSPEHLRAAIKSKVGWGGPSGSRAHSVSSTAFTVSYGVFRSGSPSGHARSAIPTSRSYISSPKM